MSFARWRQDGLNADLVASELAKGIAPLPTGGLRYSGSALFGEPLALLETGVEFLVPISDADRTRIIGSALEAALRSKSYGQSALIGEINKAARDFARSPESGYVVATGLSFEHFEDLTRMEPSGCRLYVRRRFPRRLAAAHQEARGRSRKYVLGGYPEEASSEGYAPAWVHVRGRSPSEAMDRALEALDLRRAIWNFALSRGARTFPPAHALARERGAGGPRVLPAPPGRRPRRGVRLARFPVRGAETVPQAPKEVGSGPQTRGKHPLGAQAQPV